MSIKKYIINIKYCIAFVLLIFYNKCMMKKLLEIKIINQFIKYFGVAIVAFIVNYASLYVLADIVKINYIVANIVAFLLGLIVNYILCKKFVFKESNINQKVEFLICAFIGVIGLGIDTGVLWFFTEKVNIYHMISKIISTGVTFIWNFGARKILYYFIEKR